MKHHISKIILLAALTGVIAFFSLSYIFIPAKSFSEHENRFLQNAPKITLNKLINGIYTTQLHDYFADQINLRAQMITIKAYCEMALGKRENNGIILANDGYLIEMPSYNEENYQHLKSNLSQIEILVKKLEENNVKAYSFIVPRKVDLLVHKLPFYSNKRSETALNYVKSPHNSLLPTLQHEDKDVFYKTDHHLNYYGTYLLYLALSNALGFKTLPIDQFDWITLSNEFYGTSYSKSGFFLSKPDKIIAPSYQNEEYQTTIVDTDQIFSGLYDLSYLNQKDKYSTFLSGNNAHVKIVDTKTEKETLLIIKDSYAHALAPYLCKHYNLEIFDPRYYTGSISSYIEENEIKNVLFLFGLDTLATAKLSIR